MASATSFFNELLPQKYIKLGLLPLHTRTISLFDIAYGEYHKCEMVHFYNYAAFSREAYNHRFKVLCHSVTRKGGHGLPPTVIQEELKIKKGQI